MTEQLTKFDLADYIPINQTIDRQEKIIKDDWVYPNEYATIRRPSIEKDFEYRAQKVHRVYRTGVAIKRYPNSSHIVEVIISGTMHYFYSSALKKVE